jgi:hypothetical protein
MLADEAQRRTGAPGPAAGTKQTATLALISVAGLLVSPTQSTLIPVLPTSTVRRGGHPRGGHRTGHTFARPAGRGSRST